LSTHSNRQDITGNVKQDRQPARRADAARPRGPRGAVASGRP